MALELLTRRDDFPTSMPHWRELTFEQRTKGTVLRTDPVSGKGT